MLDAKPMSGISILEEEQGRERMTTGSPDLDSLIGGIEQGSSYMFYGDGFALDALAHQLLVNCVSPREAGGFDGNAAYFNNTDYHSAKTSLSPTRLGEVAKKLGIDPGRVFESVIVGTAYNEERQKLVCQEICDALSQKEIKLLVVRNATCFLQNSRDVNSSIQKLAYIVGLLRKACASRTALVVTAGAVKTSGYRIPKTMGGSFFQARAERHGSPQEVERWNTIHQGNARQAPAVQSSPYNSFSSRQERR
jgi:hypothetical protein